MNHYTKYKRVNHQNVKLEETKQHNRSTFTSLLHQQEYKLFLLCLMIQGIGEEKYLVESLQLIDKARGITVIILN